MSVKKQKHHRLEYEAKYHTMMTEQDELRKEIHATKQLQIMDEALAKTDRGLKKLEDLEH